MKLPSPNARLRVPVIAWSVALLMLAACEPAAVTDPVEALEIIRSARPIADIGYAADALDHYHRYHDVSPETRIHDRDRLEAWQRGYPTTGLHVVRPTR